MRRNLYCLYVSLISLMIVFSSYTPGISGWWIFKTNKERIIGEWDRMGKYPVHFIFYKRGLITGKTGRVFGTYEFLDDNKLRFRRERGEGQKPIDIVLNVEFPSNSKMIWYRDNKVLWSFVRVGD